MLFDASDPRANDQQPFGSEERAFDIRATAVAPETSAGGDDAMVGKAPARREAHQRAHGPGGSGRARETGQVPVCRHLAGWNETDQSEHPGCESRGPGRHGAAIASRRTSPSVRDRVSPTRWASVGAMSTGVAGPVYCPGLMPAP